MLLDGLLLHLMDAITFALTTALAVLGLCVVAIVAWQLVSR